MSFYYKVSGLRYKFLCSTAAMILSVGYVVLLCGWVLSFWVTAVVQKQSVVIWINCSGDDDDYMNCRMDPMPICMLARYYSFSTKFS